ncbi:MAG: ribonuclease HII [Sphingomonadales bacterium]
MLAAYYKKNEIEAGCDEAGRGCYAGPVVAAAVILPKNFKHPLLNDSKKLSAAQREILRPIIEEQAIAWGIGIVDHEEIDKINILKASFKAMHKAIDQLSKKPGLLLIDGNRFSAYPTIKHQCFVKGDGRFASIAAASILAKTHRDQLMQTLHAEFPQYGWDRNKGYGTAAHRKTIYLHGLCRYHRKSFRLLPTQGSLDY